MRTYQNEKYGNIITVFVVSLSLIICFIAEGFAAAGNVKNDCLRLHILACSDSVEDQEVKLKVRDAVLECSEELFSGSASAEDACKKITENKDIIEDTADKVLKDNGFSYKAQLRIEKEYFETRQYGDVTLPAGEYTACKIILGEGKGHNWWCVMFPPICLPAAADNSEEDVYAVFGKNGGDLVTGKSGYKIKFKIVEIVEELIESAKNKS